jgi:hypothetical protein
VILGVFAVAIVRVGTVTLSHSHTRGNEPDPPSQKARICPRPGCTTKPDRTLTGRAKICPEHRVAMTTIAEVRIRE